MSFLTGWTCVGKETEIRGGMLHFIYSSDNWSGLATVDMYNIYIWMDILTDGNGGIAPIQWCNGLKLENYNNFCLVSRHERKLKGVTTTNTPYDWCIQSFIAIFSPPTLKIAKCSCNVMFILVKLRFQPPSSNIACLCFTVLVSISSPRDIKLTMLTVKILHKQGHYLLRARAQHDLCLQQSVVK